MSYIGKNKTNPIMLVEVKDIHLFCSYLDIYYNTLKY